MNTLSENMMNVPMVIMGMPMMGLAIVVMGMASLVNYFLTVPFIQTIVNTTSVFLNNTQLVWRPAYETSLVILKPLSAYALTVFRPITDLALVAVEIGIRSMIIFGYYTVLSVRSFSKVMFQIVNITKEAGISLGTALQNSFEATKDFTGAVVTLIRGLGYISYKTIQGASYIVNSFEEVSNFMVHFFFHPNEVTWDDVYNIAFPFMIVGAIIGYVAWRSYNVLIKPHRRYVEVPKEKFTQQPRRSSRIARKRAMITGEDLSALSR